VGNGAYGPQAEGAYAEAAAEQPLSRSTTAGAFSAPVGSMVDPSWASTISTSSARTT